MLWAGPGGIDGTSFGGRTGASVKNCASAVAGNADGDDVVAATLEGGDDRGGRRQRDLVLAGAPAEDHAHARHERIVAVRLVRP